MRGLRILDLTRVLAGPFATQSLADQGATVVKIEPPGGDETRGFGPIVRGASTYFASANRNKRSLVLDLQTPAGQQILHRLLETTDVIVENYRPGVAERLGFGWTDLHAKYPRLLYVAIHAFGHPEDGVAPEWTGRPGYDLVLQAMGGAVSTTGFPGSPPIKHSLSVADLLSGLLATQAVLFGLLERERTGRTQKIVVNMLQAQVAALTYHATRLSVTGEVEVKRGNAHRGLVPYDIYPCADGWLALACGNDAIWKRLLPVLGLPDKPEWRTNAQRVALRAEIEPLVAATLALRAVSEVDAACAAAGVPAGPVLTMDQTLAHPAATLVHLEDPDLGPMQTPGPSLSTLTTRRDHVAAPRLGQDRDEVLAEAGYSTAEIEALAAAGAFGA